MKKLMLTSILAALVALGTTGMAQDHPDEYLGLPGDNLNLYAVMKLFQESETLEGFERNLNAENSKINNLDLNGDNYIDYITVSDYPDGDDHTIVMRVALDRKEFQDVAVFTVQKFHNGTVQIQLIGDETLYGKNYIIEPNYDETPNPGYMGRPGNRTNVTVVNTTPYEISYWPLIRYIYMPSYVGWRSSWYWGYYPEWWSPWRPYYWHYYYGYHYNFYNDYYAHYRHWNYYRYSRYNDFYYHGVRAYSPVIQVNITKNVYRNTYSRPEQRKEGEALYSRMHPERDSRTVASRSASTHGRQTSGVRGQPATRSSAEQRPVASTRPATGNRQPAGIERQEVVRSTDVSRLPVARSSSEQRPTASTRPSTSTRPEASTRPSSSTRPATVNRQPAGNERQEVVRSTDVRSQAATQRSSATSASRPSAPSQKSSTVSSSRSSAPSQRSSGTSASRSSGQSQISSATRSSQPSRSSSSSSSSKSSSSKSSSIDSKSGRR